MSMSEVKTEVKDMTERLANGTEHLRKQKRGDLEGTGDGRRREKLVGGQVRVRTEQYQTGSTEVPELALLVQALK